MARKKSVRVQYRCDLKIFSIPVWLNPEDADECLHLFLICNKQTWPFFLLGEILHTHQHLFGVPGASALLVTVPHDFLFLMKHLFLLCLDPFNCSLCPESLQIWRTAPSSDFTEHSEPRFLSLLKVGVSIPDTTLCQWILVILTPNFNGPGEVGSMRFPMVGTFTPCGSPLDPQSTLAIVVLLALHAHLLNFILHLFINTCLFSACHVLSTLLNTN